MQSSKEKNLNHLPYSNPHKYKTYLISTFWNLKIKRRSLEFLMRKLGL